MKAPIYPRLEGPPLTTATNVETKAKGCAELEMVLMNDKMTKPMPMPIRVQAAVSEDIP